MQKLVAVKITDTAAGFRVSGYKANQKNRTRVWTLDVDREDKGKIPEFVAAAEALRLRNAEQQGELT